MALSMAVISSRSTEQVRRGQGPIPHTSMPIQGFDQWILVEHRQQVSPAVGCN
jgi:hypothetical protein